MTPARRSAARRNDPRDAAAPAPCRIRLLSADQEQRVRAALIAGATRDEAAASIGISRSMLDQRLRDQLRDVRVGQGRRGRREPYRDPTPAEIAYRASIIRRGWSPERWLRTELPQATGHRPGAADAPP